MLRQTQSLGEGEPPFHPLGSPRLIQRVCPGGSNLGSLMPVLAEAGHRGLAHRAPGPWPYCPSGLRLALPPRTARHLRRVPPPVPRPAEPAPGYRYRQVLVRLGPRGDRQGRAEKG